MLNQKERANEKAKIRKGTRCKICGEPITANDFAHNNVISAEGGCLGGVIYGHRECCEMRAYSYEHLVRNKKATYSGIQFGVELESNAHTTAEQRLQLYAFYGLVCTSDCTVEEEFKSGINQGLHGIKKYFEGIEKITDISSGTNCGSHINISLAKWQDNGAMFKIMEYSTELFKPLAQAIKDLQPSKRIEIFGRDFGNYREYTEYGFEHGDWLQIKNSCLEFRLSRYNNPIQYSHLIMLYAEMCKAIDNEFLSNPNHYTATATANTLIKLLQKHTSGKAKYQRAERNQ